MLRAHRSFPCSWGVLVLQSPSHLQPMYEAPVLRPHGGSWSVDPRHVPQLQPHLPGPRHPARRHPCRRGCSPAGAGQPSPFCNERHIRGGWDRCERHRALPSSAAKMTHPPAAALYGEMNHSIWPVRPLVSYVAPSQNLAKLHDLTPFFGLQAESSSSEQPPCPNAVHVKIRVDVCLLSLPCKH